MNSCVFDIETTSLGAVGAGILLAVCVRPTATQRTRSFRLDQYDFKASKEYGIVEREEKALLTDVMDELDKYDVLIGHNVIRYDIPYLKSRAFQRDKEAKRKESMDEIVDHCSRDVRLNANVFRYLWNADPRPVLKKIY